MIKRILISIFIILNTSTASYAVTEMGWTSTMGTNVTAAKNAGDAKYLDFKSKVDNNTCQSNNYGLAEAWMYKATGTTSYCDQSFADDGGCGSTVSGSAQPDRNKTRDCFVERALAYSICGDVVSGANKATWETQLDDVVNRVKGVAPYANHGTRPWDTDELNGHYFGCMIYDIAKNGALDVCTTGAFGAFGGVDSTGENTTTLRNALDLYWSNFADGTFVEGSIYNTNTILYAVEGVHALNNFYGSDKFPEITSLYDDFADFHYQYETPDYSQNFQFGDIISGEVRANSKFRTVALYAVLAHLDSNDVRLWDLWDDIYAENTSCTRPWLGFYKHDATKTKASGQTAFNAADAGIALWHEDWGNNDTFFMSRYKPFFNADHDWGTFENFAVWRNDNYDIDFPRHYYGDNWNENPWLNSLLVNSGFGRMREAVGQVAYEAGSDYMYHSGVTSGFVQNSGNFSDPPPAWITEHAVQRLFRHNPDGTETIFDYHRLDACNPSSTSCMTAAKKARLSLGQAAGTSGTSASAYGRAEANSWNHEYVINADTLPVQSGDKFSWNADNGDAVELYTFMDSYTDTQIDLCELSGGVCTRQMAVTPYYFTASPVNQNERTKYQLRLEVTAPGARTFLPLLNTIHIENAGGSADSYTEIYNTTGSESVQGAMVENGIDRVVFLASAEQDLTTTFTSSISGSATTFDPDRFTKASAMQKFKSDGQASFASDDTKDIEVFIVGLDTNYTWTVLKNGVSAGCTVSANGICNFTITGAIQTHTVTWSVSGATDCDDFCNLCASQVACEASVQTCYWHNNGGATSDQCNTDPAPSDNCPTEPTSCSNQSDCETNGYCWFNNACISECTGTFAELLIYASEDTRIEQANATTNYDTQGLKIVSSEASSGSENVNTSTFTLGGADSGFLTQTSTRISASSSQRDNSTNYSYKDYGSGHFGEFDLSFNFNTGSHGSSGLVGILCFSDSAGVTMGGMNSADDGLCVQYGRVLTPDGARIRNYEAGTPTNSSVITLATNTYYYADFDVTGTTATLAIYTDAAKTTHATGSPVTLTVNSGATEKYQYLYGITSGGTEGSATSRSDAYVESIVINQADSGGSPSSTDINSLLQFSLASIPAGALILSVELEGKWSASGAGNSGVLYAYEGLRDFNETQATWNLYSTGNSWTTGGARGATDMSGTWNSGSGALASYTFSGIQSTGDLATFTSTGAFSSFITDNIGGNIYIYVNQAPETTASVVQLYDSENATTTNRPHLNISYYLDDTITPPVLNPKKTLNGGRLIGRLGN